MLSADQCSVFTFDKSKSGAELRTLRPDATGHFGKKKATSAFDDDDEDNLSEGSLSEDEGEAFLFKRRGRVSRNTIAIPMGTGVVGCAIKEKKTQVCQAT